MWPSQEAASRVYDLANLGLIVGLVIGVVATILIVWMGNIKEGYLRRGFADANARAEEAKAEAAASQQRAAQAEERAAESKLALARFRAQRKLTPDQRKEFIAKLKEFSGTAFDIAGSSHETLVFALSIESVLTEAGWDRKSWTGGGNPITLPSKPFLAGNVITEGVDVKILDPEFSKARDALVDALKSAGFEGVMGTANDVPPEFPNRNVIHVMVGTKP